MGTAAERELDKLRALLKDRPGDDTTGDDPHGPPPTAVDPPRGTVL